MGKKDLGTFIKEIMNEVGEDTIRQWRRLSIVLMKEDIDISIFPKARV